MTILEALAILEAAVLECKKRDIKLDPAQGSKRRRHEPLVVPGALVTLKTG